ncbi:MAG: cyclic nucleotide-binding protein [Actinobacteria bacterium]|jgi:CRP-like cAMP-binding protein|nr:cyclic nucleotide-binding protein [Acidobacteriota bacterium]MBS1195990.1 cyclic nucleotide-binding protein [Actinomycetota bacterium]
MPGSDEQTPIPLELLAAHPFVVGMEEAQLRRIAECALKVTHFATDQVIFHSGGVARHLYLLRHGDVALEVVAPGAGTRVVSTLHGGDALGWSWMFPPYRWAFDARALVETEAIVVDGEQLRRCAEADHELGYQVVRRVAREMADRLQAARFQLLDVYGERP